MRPAFRKPHLCSHLLTSITRQDTKHVMSSIRHVHACACAVRAYMRACVLLCVRACVRACVRVRAQSGPAMVASRCLVLSYL